MNIFEVIKQETASFAGRTAVIEGDFEITYGKLISSAQQIAESLTEKGVAAFHRVGLVCGNRIDYISISLAILSLSAVVVPVSPDYPEEETKAVIKEIKLDFLISGGGLSRDQEAEKIGSLGLAKNNFLIKSFFQKQPAGNEFMLINPAFIRFSSGTTGKSKGVVLSHESIIQRTEAADKVLMITEKDSVLWVLSMSYHFVVTILLFLRRAATIILCHQSFPDSLIEAVRKHEITLMYASPFHYELLCGSDLLPDNSLKIKRYAISTTMRLPEKTAQNFFSKFGLELAQAYGIIEVGLPFVNFSQEKRSSVGRILPDYKMKIIEPDSNGVGKIYLKGKGMLDAYFSPWRTREEILENGWFNTGDLGRVDKEGFLSITGRKQNVINYTGVKVFPDEVEAVLNQHHQIRESLVFGEDHPAFGQLPAARVVLKNRGDNLDLHDLRRFCYQRLARYKVPKQFECVESLPRTASGKLIRTSTEPRS